MVSYTDYTQSSLIASRFGEHTADLFATPTIGGYTISNKKVCNSIPCWSSDRIIDLIQDRGYAVSIGVSNNQYNVIAATEHKMFEKQSDSLIKALVLIVEALKPSE